jgi:hypothetical protein
VLFEGRKTRYTRFMSPRIELDESAPDATIAAVATGLPPAPLARQFVDADWEHATAEALMLYVAEEPRVGLEFSYHGLSWRIVDYSEGWVATLAID